MGQFGANGRFNFEMDIIPTEPQRFYRLLAPDQRPSGMPAFRHFSLLAGNVVLGASDGPLGRIYSVLTSTNLELPLTDWTWLATDRFDGAGRFWLTNAVDPGEPQRFYCIVLP